LLQSIGVDVKSPQAALDESTVLAILQGKTHAPKQLIVRDTESKAFRPQKSALSRIKIIEKSAASAPPARESRPEEEPAREPRRAESKGVAKPAELARTAVIAPEPESEPEPPAAKPAAPAPPRKIALPPRPSAAPRPSAQAGAVRPTGP